MAIVKCYCGTEFENQGPNSRNGRTKIYCSSRCGHRSPSNKAAMQRSREIAAQIEVKSTAFIPTTVANESYIKLVDGRVVQVRKTTETEFRAWVEQFIETLIEKQKPNDTTTNRMRKLVKECMEIEICGNSKWYFLDEINRMTPYKKSGLSMFFQRERAMV